MIVALRRDTLRAMRLTPDEIAAIRDCAVDVFGPDAVVRLFGSRVHDDLAGGDIDLHVTADRADSATNANEWRFLSALWDRLGERRIDVLVNGPTGPSRPIERIAVMTGMVLPDIPAHVVDQIRHAKRTGSLAAYREDSMAGATPNDLLAEALVAGELTTVRLRRVHHELTSWIPFDELNLASLSWDEQLRTDALLQQFTNLVGIVQDSLIRGILLASEERLDRLSRLDQRHVAEKIGALPADVPFQAIADARNEIAHQYPADPGAQALILNRVAAAVPDLIRAFEALAAYAEKRVLRRDGIAGGS